MKKLEEYKTFIFDLDNTLYDYSECDKLSYNKVADWISAKFNVSFNEAISLICLGKTLAKSSLDAKRSSSHNRFLYFQQVAELLNSNNVIADTIEMHSIYSDTFYNLIKPYEWVEQFFKEHQCCICTNMIAAIQFEKLIALGIDKYIKLIVTSEEADIEKPSDDIYVLLVNKLRNHEITISDCLFIGDNLEHDVIGPRRIGFDSMHVSDFLNALRTEKLV